MINTTSINDLSTIESYNMSENLSRFFLLLFISLSVTIIGLFLITTEVRPASV